jgi:nitroimidazol reductase NimA-like FMN-containing flavoprotein (pyridoxamine 5'-phosphate oxidase superfamily)
MRRKEKEISSESEIEAIIKKATVCRLGLFDGEYPYIVPMSFGYHDKVLYFHSAPAGQKINIINKNPRVCFEFDIDTEPKLTDTGCKCSMKYKSVIGFGQAVIIQETTEKQQALKILMEQYNVKHNGEFPEEAVQKTLVFKVEITSMTGKQSGF